MSSKFCRKEGSRNAGRRVERQKGWDGLYEKKKAFRRREPRVLPCGTGRSRTKGSILRLWQRETQEM